MKWINVLDKSPEDLKSVIFTDGKEIFKGYRISSSVDDWFSWYTEGDFKIYDVTHWMTLPFLPKKNNLK